MKLIKTGQILLLISILVMNGGSLLAEDTTTEEKPATEETSDKEPVKEPAKEETAKKPLLPDPLIGEALVVMDKETPVPEFTFAAKDAKNKSLKHYKGNVVLLHFWATDCDPCVAELPALDRLQSGFKGDSFKVVAIAVGCKDPKEIQDFYKKYQIVHLDTYVDCSHTPDAIPVSYLIDKKGNIVASIGGPSEWKQAKNLNMIRKYLGQ